MSPPHDPLVDLPDGELIARVARMDADAFATFYDRHLSSAFAIAYRIVGARQPADDICQEAFLAVWRSASRYEAHQGEVRSWFLAVVRNRAIDHLRRSTRHAAHEVHDEALAERHAAPADEGTEAQALRRNDAHATRALLDELNDDQRRVIELAFYSGYSHREIADMLVLPLGTVKARVNRGLARMRTAIGTGGPA